MGWTDSRGRALVLLIACAVIGSALHARLAYRQLGQRDFLAEEALQQPTMKETTPSRRGYICVRTGVVVLATTIERERLIANPSQINDVGRRLEVAVRLVGFLNLTGDDAAQLTTRVTSEK